MAEAKGKAPAAGTPAAGTTASDAGGDASERAKVKKEMRPVFGEVARLSATLGLARQACYTGEPAKAVKALALLAKQLPLALEMAELLAPTENA